LLAHGRWFSQGTPASSTNKTSRHDIAEILLKVALNTKNQINHYEKIILKFVVLSVALVRSAPFWEITCIKRHKT